MTRHLLLIILFSWSLLVTISHQCESAVAVGDHILSVQRSLLANADVAVLKSYNTSGVKQCIEECCIKKYGSCTVASFNKNTTQLNCLHFNCLPLSKCKFLSSKSVDSFTFSSSSHSPTVPSESSDVTTEVTTPKPEVAFEKVATFSDEQLALKNDNTTVKPRKGVDEVPRYTSTTSRSKVKPRKGVGPDPGTTPLPTDMQSFELMMNNSDLAGNTSNELIQALQKVFEDDSDNTSASVIETTLNITPTPVSTLYIPSTVSIKPVVRTTTIKTTTTATTTIKATTRAPLRDQLFTTETPYEEDANERYRASMHLVLSLVFGLLVLFAVLGVVAKRIYDGWLRRHYHRMDFLIDGMYDGYN